MINRRSFVATSLGASLQTSLASGATAVEFYVAPDGSDANPGNKAKPFATFQRARDQVRKLITKPG